MRPPLIGETLGGAARGTAGEIMPRSLYRWVEQHATLQTIGISLVAWLLAATGLRMLQARVSALSGAQPVPDIRPLYTGEELYALLELYGASGRSAFFHFAVYDLFYPFLAYGLAALVLAALSRPLVQAHPAFAYVILLPLAGLLVELLEQGGFLVALACIPTRLSTLAAAVAALTALKFLLLTALLSALVGLGLWRLLGKRTA
jgi:hypothetical protein